MQQVKTPEGPRPSLPAPAPDPIEALAVTLCLCAPAHPRRVTRAWVVNCEGGGGGNVTASLAPNRPHPVRVTVGMAAVPAPATPPPLGRPQDPDPHTGKRVFIDTYPSVDYLGCCCVHPHVVSILYAHSPRGRPGTRRWPWVPSGGGNQPVHWQRAPR